jgi:micrococcal nuclease
LSTLILPLFLILAATLHGTATRIIDGDSLIVTDSHGVTHTIRLLSIDAPERSQPYGTEATAALKSLVQGKRLRAEIAGRDRYGRELATVFIGRRNVNLALVEMGAAWHYKRFSKDARFAAAEKRARAAKRGLWSREAVPPWVWRKRA